MRRYVKLLLRSFITNVSTINQKLILEMLAYKKVRLRGPPLTSKVRSSLFLEQEHESIGTTYEISKLPLLGYHQFLPHEATNFWPPHDTERASTEVLRACHACRN